MLYANTLDHMALVSAAAAEFLATHDLATLSCGRYELGGEEYVNVMEYDAKDRATCVYESHERYLDAHVVIEGREALEIAPTAGLTPTKPYDPVADFALYDGGVVGERVELLPGTFCVVWPADAHIPGIALEGEQCHVKKAVFKLLVR